MGTQSDDDAQPPQAVDGPIKGRPGPPLGNKNAAKGRPFAKALAEALERAEKAPNCKYRLAKLAQKALQMAANGDLDAMKLVVDRLDGKALQSMDITHNQGAQLLHDSQANDLAHAFLESKRIAEQHDAERLAAETLDKAAKQ